MDTTNDQSFVMFSLGNQIGIIETDTKIITAYDVEDAKNPHTFPFLMRSLSSHHWEYGIKMMEAKKVSIQWCASFNELSGTTWIFYLQRDFQNPKTIYQITATINDETKVIYRQDVVKLTKD